VAYGTDSCRVLEFDPDLGNGIDPEEWALARSACVASLYHVPAGAWEIGELAAEQPHLLAFVIVAGLVCHDVALGKRHMFEFLGPGDVVQPPVAATRPRLGAAVVCTAAVDTTVMALGESFIRAAARWPSLLVAAHERLEAHRENLAIQGLIAQFARAEHRVLLQLWHLADRWGRVTTEGTLVPLSLTHELLGQMIAARRPTVTLAVASLESAGLIRRVDGSAWLLTPAAERAVAAIVGDGTSDRALGEMFRHRARGLSPKIARTPLPVPAVPAGPTGRRPQALIDGRLSRATAKSRA
jgi:CRP/FNR family transcriptional regulator, cyclic AMP receptor protein